MSKLIAGRRILEAAYGDSSHLWSDRKIRWQDSGTIDTSMRNEIWRDILQIIKLSAKLGKDSGEACKEYGLIYTYRLHLYVPDGYEQWKTSTTQALEKFKGTTSADVVTTGLATIMLNAISTI